MLSSMDTVEVVAKVGGAILVVFGVIAGITKGVKWIGASVSTFVDEKILPPIDGLSKSVDDLADRMHESTGMMTAFIEEQQNVNLQTAKRIAHMQGHLGIEEQQ